MPISKTIVQITILHPSEDDVSKASLDQIGREIDDGDWLGQLQHISTEPVQSNNVESESIALGNDGTFFAGELEDDCEAGIHSWVNETGKLPPDTPCAHCGALYGHPD